MGISYTTWRMHKLGVSSARSTFAQVIRYVTGFLSLLVLLVIAVLALAIDGKVNRYIVAASFLLIIVVLALTFGLIFVFSSKRRMQMTAAKLSKFINTLVKIVTLGKKRRVMKSKKVEEFFVDMQDDFQDLSNHPKLLIKPIFGERVYTVLTWRCLLWRFCRWAFLLIRSILWLDTACGIGRQLSLFDAWRNRRL